MINVIWSIQAQADIDVILRFYEREDVDLSRRIERAIIASPDFLAEFPSAGPPVGSKGLRKWRIGKLPFVLLYRIRNNVIEVASVRHMAQNWRRAH